MFVCVFVCLPFCVPPKGEVPPTPGPEARNVSASDHVSRKVIIGVAVAGGVVLFITLIFAACAVRKLVNHKKGKMHLDQEKAVANGNSQRYTNPAFVARPQEEAGNSKDSTPKYLGKSEWLFDLSLEAQALEGFRQKGESSLSFIALARCRTVFIGVLAFHVHHVI